VGRNLRCGSKHSARTARQHALGGCLYRTPRPQTAAKHELGQSPINLRTLPQVRLCSGIRCVATAVRTGATIPTESWFENNIPSQFCLNSKNVAITCSAWIAGVQSANFVNGGVSNIFSTIDGRRMLVGLPTFNNYLAQGIFFRSSTGEANYHALLVTVDKRVSRGLSFTANYTFSHSLDQIGAIRTPLT